MAVLTSGLQFLMLFLSNEFWARGYTFVTSGWYTWGMTFIPLYLIGMPVCVCIMRKAPEQKTAAVRFGELFCFSADVLPPDVWREYHR